MKLAIRIKQLEDGTFKVMVWWHLGWNVRTRYCHDAEELSGFLDELVKKTAWKVFENVPNDTIN